MANFPTPHINAKPSDFAKTVLMPGDPMRAKFVADNFLSDAVLVNNVRGIQGYTGKYKDKYVSVMASGMGMPSIGIYSHELYNNFNVENIVRIGSAGGYSKNVSLRDIVIAMGSCTDSRYAHQFHLPGTFAPIASYDILKTCVETADEMSLNYHVGNILSSDVFYGDDECLPEQMRSVSQWAKMGVLAVEMEAAALYMNAARAGKRALAICTVSDHLLTGESLSSDERQNSFTQMITLALEAAIKLY